jgi:hypothetical protein
MIDGNHFIQLGGKLAAAAEPDEVACRTAVSRAYYGVFHLALAFLSDLGILIPANANAHAAAQRYLIASGHPDAQHAGTLLGDLHSDRIKADYRLDDARFERVGFTRLKVALAHDARSALTACGQENAKAAIKTGIDEYKSRIGEA